MTNHEIGVPTWRVCVWPRQAKTGTPSGFCRKWLFTATAGSTLCETALTTVIVEGVVTSKDVFPTSISREVAVALEEQRNLFPAFGRFLLRAAAFGLFLL